MGEQKKNPPRLARWLLLRLNTFQETFVLSGDLDEAFHSAAKEKGISRARFWYWTEAVGCVLAYLASILTGRFGMWKHQIKIAFRTALKTRIYTLLNMAGLSLGLMVFMLIALYIQFELSYDKYHENRDRIFRISQTIPQSDSRSATTSAPLAEALRAEFPEIEKTARIFRIDKAIVATGEKSYFESNFLWADPELFQIFSFDLTRGDIETVLDTPRSVVLSSKTAVRYFGDENPVGRILRYSAMGFEIELMVTGVFSPIPANSHFKAELIASFGTLEDELVDVCVWGNGAFHTYILLRPNIDPQSFEERLRTADFQKYSGGYDLHHYFLQNVGDIHLKSHIGMELDVNNDIGTLFLFGSIGVLILLIACVNAVNLSTANATFRLKEVGLCKVVGAHRGQLLRQFLMESMAMTIVSFFAAMGLAAYAMPFFRNLAGKEIPFRLFQNMELLGFLLLVLAATGLLAGMYPAMVMSSFKPVALFHGKTGARSKTRTLRNWLVVFQFSISIILMICMLGSRKQIEYLRKRDMGYNREQIVTIPINDPRLAENIESLETELKSDPQVLYVTHTQVLLNDVMYNLWADWPGKPQDQEFYFRTIDADYDFIDCYGMRIVAGRNFSRDFPSDPGGAFLINETAAKQLGWESPLGRSLKLIDRRRGEIVGVIQDFHIQDMTQPIQPLAVYFRPLSSEWYHRYLSIKILPDDILSTLQHIQETLHRRVPGYPFEYSFFDELFEGLFEQDQRLERLFSLFAFIAVFVACMGLFGLASFSAVTRTKEIGIRKVLGSSISGVVLLLGREFLKWVLVANAIAWPAGYWILHRWLGHFVYRIRPSLILFVASGLIALIIAAMTVSFQTLKAASANPARILKYE